MKRPVILLSCLLVQFAACDSGPMFDPAIDDPAREWSYAAKSTTVIGLPFVPEPVQVTNKGVHLVELRVNTRKKAR